jgi:hypothetical protein
MTKLARFSVTSVPLGPDEEPATQYRLSCPHGETTMSHLSGPAPDEQAVLAILATRHEAAERCGCAASVSWDEARA